VSTETTLILFPWLPTISADGDSRGTGGHHRRPISCLLDNPMQQSCRWIEAIAGELMQEVSHLLAVLINLDSDTPARIVANRPSNQGTLPLLMSRTL